MSRIPALTIYKASAGSGKTFTLAVEYIKLLVLDPENYRYILAVTFTNKATDEMKTRILEKLYDIANLPDDGKDDYLNKLLTDLGPNAPRPLPAAMIRPFLDYVRMCHHGQMREAIKARAAEAMHNILHNYTYFRIVTIDTFFQGVVRNLAHELGLPANMQVTLNDKEVEQKAVDNIVDGVGEYDQDGDQSKLLSWMLAYARQKIDDQKNWNFISAVKDFGTNIFTEEYQENQKELKERLRQNPNLFADYIDALQKMRAKADADMKAAATTFDDLCKQHGVTSEMFSNGVRAGKLGGVPNYFEKLRKGDYYAPDFSNKTINDHIAEPEKMMTGAGKKKFAGYQSAIQGPIHDHLEATERKRLKHAMTRVSVDLTLANINELQLLGRIEEEVRRLHEENHTHPLSGTQRLIKGMHLDKHDAPFVYEKIGGVLKYIMIDEFQDTSTVQWENFKVLLQECLSRYVGSLIVGDVKQSIYRWRNGNWELLHDLNHDPDLDSGETTLETNYRSDQNVIDFNNAFFQITSRLVYNDSMAEIDALAEKNKALDAGSIETLRQEVRKNYMAYQDVFQKGKPTGQQREGSVAIRLIEKKKDDKSADNNDGDEADEKDMAMIGEVEQIVRRLLAIGTPQKKIAVLVRKNGQINGLANYFLQHPLVVDGQQVSWVSDEAFRLDASLAVTTIVGGMRLLLQPDDNLLMATLVKAAHRVAHPDTPVDDRGLFVDTADHEELEAAADVARPTSKVSRVNKQLASLLNGFLDRRPQLLAMPLIDMAEAIYQHFHLDQLADQSAYLCAFFDHLAAFMQNRTASLEEFVKEWDNVLSSKSIHSSEVNGIRLITVHKSKGLEFDHVIMPYCDWTVEMQKETFWVQPPVAPYNWLPLVPLKLYAKKLKASVYAGLYQSEHLKNIVDNLNIIYVAFTRAKRNLFILGYQGGRIDWPSKLLAQFIQQTSPIPSPLTSGDAFPEEVSLATLLPGYAFNEATATFTYGNSPILWTEEQTAERKALIQTATAKNDEGDKVQSFNVFKQVETPVPVRIQSFEQHGSFKQSSASERFVMTEEDKEEAKAYETYIKTGNLLHELFSMIRDDSQVEQAVKALEYDGTLNGRKLSRSALLSMVEGKLQQPTVASWFRLTDDWQVFNECSILTPDNRGRLVERRPDRVIRNEKTREMVVVDFKTRRYADNDPRRDEYIGQVREYMTLLSQIDPDYAVTGYLWYIQADTIIPVNL